MKTVHERPWVPNGYVTSTGLALSEQHVLKVLPFKQARAALLTTGIIQKMMQP